MKVVPMATPRGNPIPGGIAMIRIDQIFLIRDSSQHQANAALLYK